jgi:hypothetical protein
MQESWKGFDAKQVLNQSAADTEGRKWITIDGVEYTVNAHDRVELNNGNWARTVVIESADNRVVLVY